MNMLAIFFEILFLFEAASSLTCPQNYTLTYSSKCFRKLHLDEYDPLDSLLPVAREECAKDGAHLPMIRNAQENDIVLQIARSIDAFNGNDVLLILDLVCNNVTHRLEWADSSLFSFTPDPQLEVDFDCVRTTRTVFSNSQDGQWYHVLTDYNMGWPFTAICVVEPVDSLRRIGRSHLPLAVAIKNLIIKFLEFLISK